MRLAVRAALVFAALAVLLAVGGILSERAYVTPPHPAARSPWGAGVCHGGCLWHAGRP
ncbi:MAG: hypothetical protein WCE44_02700 [Candidatus Velthaea sp.]